MAERVEVNGEEVAKERAKETSEDGPFWNRKNWREIIPDIVRDHLDFHKKNGEHSKTVARVLDAAILIISGSIPVAAAVRAPQAILGGLGALVAVLAGLGHQLGWKENAIRHNRVLMAIQQELIWYKYGKENVYSGDASVGDRNKLVLRVEDIVQADAATWAATLARNVGAGDGLAPSQIPTSQK